MVSRRNLQRHKRSKAYDGANIVRNDDSGFVQGLDVNQLIAANSSYLRGNARRLIRNFPPFARAVNAIVAFTVGRGSRFQSLAVLPDGSPDYAARRKIEDRFRLWMEKADSSGRLHFYELQALAKRQECECGEFIGIFTTPRDRSRYPLAIQLYDPENLAGWSLQGQGRDTDIFEGIEYDTRTGEPIAYHFQTAWLWQGGLRVWREDARNVLHGYHVLRPGQLRGVTPFAPAILLARAMGDYTNAELDAAKMAAKWLGFVKSADPAFSQAVRNDGPDREKQREDLKSSVENAVVEYLAEGEDVSWAPNFQRPGDSFDRFTKFALRMIAITMDLPYEILSGDYTNINYSTSKASRNDFQMFLALQQFRMEQHFIRPVFHRWLDMEALTQPYLAGYWEDPERYKKAMWIPAGMPSVDPLRDGKAAIAGVEAGLASPQMVILGAGHDPEEVVAQRASWLELCRQAGVDAGTGDVSLSSANNPAALGAPETGKE